MAFKGATQVFRRMMARNVFALNKFYLGGSAAENEVTVSATALNRAGGGILQEGTKVNAEASSVVLAAADIAVIGNDDTVEFGGETFTKTAGGAGENEFANAAGLAAKIHALDDWNAAESDGAVTVTSAVKGAFADGEVATIKILSVSTAGGAEAAKSEATVPAADIARLAAGDIVKFDGNTFTKVASDAGAGEFTNTAGLAALIDALDDWTAAVDSTDIDITAAENGAANDGVDVEIELYSTTANGVNGSVGLKGQVFFDDGFVYVCTANNTINDANWKKAAIA
jgi:hypothetical protein